MLSSTAIAAKIRSAGLDAEDTDFYDNTLNIIPAINNSIRFILGSLQALHERKKMTGEAFRELNKTGLYFTNLFSKCILPSDLWILNSVIPLPIIHPGNYSHPTPSDVMLSEEVIQAVYVGSNRPSAYRATTEEFNNNKMNPFAKGNILGTCPDVIEYSYLSPSIYKTGLDLFQDTMIEISPSLPHSIIAYNYISNHPNISSLGTNDILIPSFLENFLIDRAISYLVRLQTEGIAIYQITEKDLSDFLRAFDK